MGHCDTEFITSLFKDDIHTKRVTIIFHLVTFSKIHDLAMSSNMPILQHIQRPLCGNKRQSNKSSPLDVKYKNFQWSIYWSAGLG